MITKSVLCAYVEEVYKIKYLKKKFILLEFKTAVRKFGRIDDITKIVYTFYKSFLATKQFFNIIKIKPKFEKI